MAPKIKKLSVKLLPAPSLARSGMKIGLLSMWLRLIHFATPSHVTMALAVVYLALSTAFTASFFFPRSVEFSFATENCFTSPTLLPNMIAKSQGNSFIATPHSSISVAGYPLYSHTTCITPSEAPQEKVTDNISFSPLGIQPLKKNITVSASELPKIDFQTPLERPISTKDPLAFPLKSADRFFEYQLIVNDKKLTCTKETSYVLCNVATLGLEQSASYTVAMQRLFRGKAQQTLFSQNVATVGAMLVTGTSVAAGSTVFDVPTALTLGFNKEIKTFDGVELSMLTAEGRQKVPVTAKAEGQTITVNLNEALARSSSFELSVQKAVAPDGGHLPAPFVLGFATSGGPKVKSVNIGSSKVSTTSNVVVTFDSPVSGSQSLGNFIKVEINGNAVATSISRGGNTVTINPNDTLPKCTRFTVKVLNGLENEFGVSGGSAWTYNSRTICQTVFGIGTSVQGRAISAYRFGSGGSYIVFVGTTHGNEKSVATLTSFIDYLEKNYDDIPSHRSVVVIPNLNPDGYAASRRTNANNVDLNRNFPANSWKQGVTMPGGTYNPNGGGSAPLSEPESSALANYILGVHPRLVLTYHAVAGVVIPNDSGDSIDLAKVYDSKSNLNFASNSQTGTLFPYDTTGAFEDWLHDKHSIPALLIELRTMTSNEFAKNQNAMWHMVQLP